MQTFATTALGLCNPLLWHLQHNKLKATLQQAVWHSSEAARLLMRQGGLDAMKLLGPFSKLLDGVVSDTFVRNWLNLLCFLLSGEALLAAPTRRTSSFPTLLCIFICLHALAQTNKSKVVLICV